MKKSDGITVISLVMTIIILIILAGISLNMTIGENGIIKKANKTKQNIQTIESEQKEQLNQLYEQLENNKADSDIETGIIEELKRKIEELENKFGKLQSEFNEFKKVIAEAITEKGVPTQSTDSAQTMAENIKKLNSGWNGKLSLCLTPGGWSSYIRIPTNGYHTIHLYDCWCNQSGYTTNLIGYYEDGRTNVICSFPIGHTFTGDYDISPYVSISIDSPGAGKFQGSLSFS